MGQAFDVQQNAFGRGIIAEIVDHVSEIDVQHGADADKMAEADALLQGQIENRRADGAALGHKGQISGVGHLGGKAGVEVRPGTKNAHAVRPHDAKTAVMGDAPHFLLDLPARFADLLAPRDDQVAGRGNNYPGTGGFSTHSFTISGTVCIGVAITARSTPVSRAETDSTHA